MVNWLEGEFQDVMADVSCGTQNIIADHLCLENTYARDF